MVSTVVVVVYGERVLNISEKGEGEGEERRHEE